MNKVKRPKPNELKLVENFQTNKKIWLVRARTQMPNTAGQCGWLYWLCHTIRVFCINKLFKYCLFEMAFRWLCVCALLRFHEKTENNTLDCWWCLLKNQQTDIDTDQDFVLRTKEESLKLFDVSKWRKIFKNDRNATHMQCCFVKHEKCFVIFQDEMC